MLGGAEISPPTLTRFYAVHCLFLPAALAALLIGHVWLARRKGPAPIHPDQAAGALVPAEVQLFRGAVASSVAVAILFGLAVLYPIRLEAIADPTDTTYSPRPEWYFLFLFQLMKYFSGRLEAVAAFVLPALVVAFLVGLPFLDRSDRPRVRPFVAGTVAAGLIGLIALTGLGMQDRPHNVNPEDNPLRRVETPTLARGWALYQSQNCSACHALGGKGGSVGPALDHAGKRRNYDVMWSIAHLKDPASLVPGSTMPPYKHLSDEDLRALTAFLFADAGRRAEVIGTQGGDRR
jgi:ubiquinol-cytochrome c reductase cytochrome b subunit